ncbi:MAG: DUF5715 family protein [Terriglobales bacterium]
MADSTSSTVQNQRADSDNLSRMTNVRMLRRFEQHGWLVPVPASTSTFYIHSIAPTYRYCRPWTKLFLTRLSRQYYAKFGDRLRVTSLVRTAQKQRALERVNGNAADASGPERSSHLTGATLDISKRFMSHEERQWMRDVLYSLRQQGHVYAIEEFWQPTFHIMVYRNYPDSLRLREGKRARKQARNRHDDDDAASVETEDAMR